MKKKLYGVAIGFALVFALLFVFSNTTLNAENPPSGDCGWITTYQNFFGVEIVTCDCNDPDCDECTCGAHGIGEPYW